MLESPNPTELFVHVIARKQELAVPTADNKLLHAHVNYTELQASSGTKPPKSNPKRKTNKQKKNHKHWGIYGQPVLLARILTSANTSVFPTIADFGLL